ncbi:MAG: SRPBCC domain-containing protein [Polyangiales bacterium]
MSVQPGDQARASVQVAVPRAEAFRVFTEEIDQWWRRGPAYRMSGARRGIIALEPRLGGRLFESFDDDAGGERVVESGRVLTWEPPTRVVFSWRATNFAPHEETEVEVTFEERARGTYVTVTHRGFASLRPDHPVRHGAEVPAFIARMGAWWGGLLTSLREHAGS